MAVKFAAYRRLKAVQDNKVTLDDPWPSYRENGQIREGYAPLFKAGYIRCTRIFAKQGPKHRRRRVQITDKGYQQLKDYEQEFMNASRYTYEAVWANKDKQFIGLCKEFPSLSWLEDTEAAALAGIKDLVKEVMHDMHMNGETVPNASK